MIRLLVLDYDGTLVDSMPALAGLATEIIARHYGHNEEEAAVAYGRTIGRPFREQLLVAFGRAEADAVVEFEQRKAALPAAPFFPAALATLEAARALGLKTALLSSTDTPLVKRRLAGSPAEALFHRVTGLASGRKVTQLLEAVAALAAGYAGDTLFVGDAAYDQSVARHVGTRFLKVEGKDSWSQITARLSPTSPVSS